MESPINTSFFEELFVSSVLSTEVEMVTDKNNVEIRKMMNRKKVSLVRCIIQVSFSGIFKVKYICKTR